jgi:hypothetical protein
MTHLRVPPIALQQYWKRDVSLEADCLVQKIGIVFITLVEEVGSDEFFNDLL